MNQDFYSVDEAAKILKLTPGRVRQMLQAGEIEGVSPESTTVIAPPAKNVVL